MIAAIIGGGVKLVQLEIAKFTSGSRQAALGGFGLILLFVGLAVRGAENMPAGPAGEAQNQSASVALAKEAANNQTAPAAVADKAEADEDEAPPPARPVQGNSLSGRWTNDNGIPYGINQEGDEFAIVAETEEGTAIGHGGIEADRIWMNFPLNSVECAGSVDTNRQVINVICEGQGSRMNLILRKTSG